MKKYILTGVQHNSRSLLNPMRIRFFGATINNEISPELLTELKIARKLAYQGGAIDAEKKYKELIEIHPKCEQIYKELFAVWYDKGSVLGLKQWDIDWLKTKYRENFSPETTCDTPQSEPNKCQSRT